MKNGPTLTEITRNALIVLSSSKSNFGLPQLLNDSDDCYWNSDGKAPHFVLLKFPKPTAIAEVHLNLNYDKDESYTPNRVAVKAGLSEGDLIDVLEVDLVKPMNWVILRLPQERFLISGFVFQISFPYNYQNGKDLRLRGLKVFSSVNPAADASNGPAPSEDILQSLSRDLAANKFEFLI